MHDPDANGCPAGLTVPISPSVRIGQRPGNGITLTEQFLNFIDEDSFPCVGAKAALSRGAIHTQELLALGTTATDGMMLDAITNFAGMVDADEPEGATVHSFAALFDGPDDASELMFENLLWSQLWRLHQLDVRRGAPWAPDVSADAESPQFSLSLAGHPFFVIGMHPRASRLARRSSSPVMVFNSHRQFERLRSDGRYEKMQAATRERDRALQGSINPNLADFGNKAEPRQYSGRKVESDWQCPYNFKQRH